MVRHDVWLTVRYVSVDWIGVVQKKKKWLAVVNTVEFSGSRKWRELLD
jgi:hypothetical protein